jgi:hypothetical protein
MAFIAGHSNSSVEECLPGAGAMLLAADDDEHLGSAIEAPDGFR